MSAQAAAFGCNTYSYIRSCRADACIARLADAGFSDFELMVYPGHLWPAGMDAEGLRRLRRIIADRALRITTLNMPNIDINVAAASPDMRDYSLKMLAGVVALAGELGVPGIVIGPGKANPLFPAEPEELTGHFYAALDRLCPLAQAAGTSLWLENMPFAYLPTIGELMDVLDRYGNDDLGIVYDVANAHFIGEDIGQGLKRCQPRLKLVHLSDTGRQAYRHDPVGQGSVPFRDIPAQLAAVGYRERTMLEIISRDPDRDIMDSVGRLTEMGFAGSATV
jgi:L-ribulose-5-phosphate 3-epimerase